MTKLKFGIVTACLFILLSYFPNVFADNNNYIFNPKDTRHFLYVPSGNGPFPAILLLHASGGIANVNHDWANILKNEGYVVYIIDSFKPRGWIDRQSVGWERATAAQLSDVKPAYDYLVSLPYVDSKRIGILGFSMGGFDVLRVMEKAKSNVEIFQTIPFKVGVSFYGVCHRLSNNAVLRSPSTIFIGANDDRSTTEDCKALIKRSNNNDISMHIYDNALHGFDNFEFPASKEIIDEKGEHYHIGYNEQARKQAIVDMLLYLNQKLK